jgi:tripartite-type tricarboxylate transporter receptor subunit TctC
MIALINIDPAVIAVPVSRGWDTLDAFLKYARANPGKLRVGIDAGSSAQIFAAAFVEKAGINVIYVPFRGGGERTVALAGGHIDADFDIIAPLKTMLEAKKVRVLAIAADHRAADYADIPTMTESGVNLSISSWHGIFAPRGTSPAVIGKISSAVGRVAANPEFAKRMRDLLLGVHYLDTPQFKEFFAEADKTNLDLIRKLGLLVTPPNATK